MRKIATCFFIFSFLLISKAQTWCPAGATWHYFDSFLAWTSYKSGVTELKFTNTVTINSIVCKELVATFTGVSPWPSSPISTNTVLTLQTYESNGVYYLYDSNSNIFDTMVNFNAVVGDKWRTLKLPSYTTTACSFPRPYETVIDTGHVTINSLFLKKVVLQNSYTNYIDTLVEKIAGFNRFFTPYYNCITDMAPYGRLMCYSDSNFPVYKKSGFVSCFYDPTRIIKSDVSEKLFGVFPNPANNFLSLTTRSPQEDLELVIIDVSGKLVLAQQVKTNNYEGYLQLNLSNGVYFVTISNTNKEKVIKKLLIAN